jgi:uncharacterized protein
MKVTLYGASGMIGSRILDELVSRQHKVTAVVRHPSKITRTMWKYAPATCSIRIV